MTYITKNIILAYKVFKLDSVLQFKPVSNTIFWHLFCTFYPN